MLGPEVVLDCDYLDMGVVESGKFSAKSFKVVNNSDVPAAFQVINVISKFLSSKGLLMSNTFRLIQLSIFNNYLQKVSCNCSDALFKNRVIWSSDIFLFSTCAKSAPLSTEWC